MAIDWGRAFNRAVKKTGEVVVAKDKDIQAEAKASAEAFAEAEEGYSNDITKNKKLLSTEVDAIGDLVGKDVGKIRTIMRTYGNANVLTQLQKDFTTYQTNAMYTEDKQSPGELKFKTLKEYINGKMTGTGNALLSDEAAEQARDEATIAGDELDIQQAAKKAKAIGVSLEDYLENQARKMSDRPAFSAKAKAARLVEESSMGLFGKTLTMEEAMQKITGGRTIGEEAKDLGDTGFALAREGGLSAEQTSKIGDRITAKQLKRGDVVSNSELASVKNQIAKELNNDVKKNIVKNNGNGSFTLLDNETAIAAAIKNIDLKLQEKSLDQKSKSVLEKLKDEYERRITNTSSKEEDNKKNEVVLKDGRIIKKEGDNFVFDKKPSISSLEQLLKDSKPGARIRINGKNYILKTFLDSIKKQKQKKIDEGQLKKKSNPFLGLS